MFVTCCLFLHIFPILFQRFNCNLAWYRFREGNKMITIWLRHDVFKNTRGPKMSLCVMYFAHSLGSVFCSFSDCSKYITFSITFTLCPPDRSVRNSACASPLRSCPPLGLHPGHLACQIAPHISTRTRLVRIRRNRPATEHPEVA